MWQILKSTNQKQGPTHLISANSIRPASFGYEEENPIIQMMQQLPLGYVYLEYKKKLVQNYKK